MEIRGPVLVEQCLFILISCLACCLSHFVCVCIQIGTTKGYISQMTSYSENVKIVSNRVNCVNENYFEHIHCLIDIVMAQTTRKAVLYKTVG